ncbi:MAG: hypothetical protein M9964_00380 [Solirubrobacterales bacterium]|nr:hypothetical protein [Solirubrobacterales bacterium]
MGEQDDLAADSKGGGKGSVSGQQRALEALGQRDVRGVVDGEVVAKLEAPSKESDVWCSKQGKILEVVDGERRAPKVDITATNRGTPLAPRCKRRPSARTDRRRLA